MTSRTFGIEFEIKNMNTTKAARILNSIGVSCQAQGYNHNLSSAWKAVTDATVHGGCEVVSPILSGTAGIEEAMAVAEALSDADGSVDRQCGMHVHFDARDLSGNNLINIVKAYADNETAIDNFMPVSRRGSNNVYCKSAASLYNAIKNKTNLTNRALASGTDRYHKVNVASFLRHGTIEFRQHSGTLNARKVSMWVNFLDQFIAAHKDDTVSTPVADQYPALPATQRRIIGLLNTMPHSADQLVEAMGIARNTVITQISRARNAGVAIRKFRGAYYLVEATTETVSQVNDLYTGIDANVVAFYQRRTRVLAA